MNTHDLVLMMFAAAIVSGILYRQISIFSSKTNNDEDLKGSIDGYKKFCNAINEKIKWLCLLAQTAKFKEGVDKQVVLDRLNSFGKELDFIQTMSATNINKSAWEEKLFGFLSKIDEFIEANFADPKNIIDQMKADLKKEFEKIRT